MADIMNFNLEGWKMKKIILSFATIAALVACTKETPGSVADSSNELQEIKLLAYAPGAEDEDDTNDTKSVLVEKEEGKYSVLWEDGDAIKVAFPPKGSSSNSDPKSEISFTLTASLSENSAKAYFVGNISDLGKYNAGYAFYPTSAGFSASRNGWTITNAFSYDLPSVQTEGFGAYNLASSYIDKNNLNSHRARAVFLNACGLIRIILPESADDVVSINVKSNNGNALAGNATLELTTIKGIGVDINADGSLNNNDYSYRLTSPTFSDGGSSEVTITNGGEAFVPGVEYNIVAWPGTHSGLTFTFVNSEGSKCKKVSPQVVLEASKYDTFNFTSEFVFTAEPNLEVSTTSFTPAAAGETLSFNVKANSNWAITENADWITVSPSSGAAGNTTVNVTFAGNMTAYARTATIKVTHAEGLERTISVSQEADDVTYKISGDYLTYASDLTDGLYVIANRYYFDYFWTESNGKLTTSTRSSTILPQHVFEYKVDKSYINGNVHNTSFNYSSNGPLNYYSWSAGVWKSVSTGLYLDENFNLNAQESNACCFQYANNWGGSGGTELNGIDVYKNPLVESTRETLWYNGSNFVFGDMNLYFNNGGVNKRKYYIYRVEKQ